MKNIGTWTHVSYEAQYSAYGTSRFIGALSPVNASPAMLPLPAHDSGLMWVANPSS